MSIGTRAVRVYQVPQKLTPATEKTFLGDLQKFAEKERPRFVLDCSKVSEMSHETIYLLLRSLEEVMMYNGDVRLASLRQEAEAALRSAGVNRLFEIYATTDGAINSFHQRAISIAPQSAATDTFDHGTENAA